MLELSGECRFLNLVSQDGLWTESTIVARKYMFPLFSNMSSFPFPKVTDQVQLQMILYSVDSQFQMPSRLLKTGISLARYRK